MGNVYRHDSQSLHDLLERASALSGATLLIPDLQRPYVWTPNQVTLLIDSLIRGWPFGTLLLWKVNHEELEGIPFRAFWTVVDRSGQADGLHVTQLNPPASYHMVLDGQQRLQSLLLAMGGDDWGFTLEDREWFEELIERKAGGRQAKYRHWSKASLCFDLQAFESEYKKQNNKLLSVDFRNVLCWCITDPQNGQSSYPKPENYENPLPKAYENHTRYIRLSRLWREAKANPGLKESHFRSILERILLEHGVAVQQECELLKALGELMTTLRDVKQADVTYLELQPYDEDTWTRDAYNDAIVSIFTRLNTAGRSLTREEITLAWLKVGWDTQSTNGRTAGECFADLNDALAMNGLNLEIDELVRTASFVWAVVHNDGRILANSDLLRGSVIRPMALALSKEWQPLTNTFEVGSQLLAQRTIEFGNRGQFASLNALAVAWTWLYIAESWKKNSSLSELDRDHFEKLCFDTAHKYFDRWLICSQWAGIWASSSGTSSEAYSKALSEVDKTAKTLSNPSQAHDVLEQCLAKFCDGLVAGASNYMNTLAVSSRDRVATYRSALWVWHRLDTERWLKSQVQLRTGKSKAKIEVDHVVSVAVWKMKCAGAADEDKAATAMNCIGNCALLEKNFNISKGNKSLKEFLSQVHEVLQKKVSTDAWCAALEIPQPMFDPDRASVVDLLNAIEQRDNEIRSDLLAFINGSKVRVDVFVPYQRQAADHDHEEAGRFHSKTPLQVKVGFESAPSLAEISVGPTIEDEYSAISIPLTTTPAKDGVDWLGLRAAYSEDPSLRCILDHFARRQYNQNVTEVETLRSRLDKDRTSIEKSDLIRALRRLDALGVGRFLVGRRGQPTRFEWHEKSLTLRQFAAEESPADIA